MSSDMPDEEALERGWAYILGQSMIPQRWPRNDDLDNSRFREGWQTAGPRVGFFVARHWTSARPTERAPRVDEFWRLILMEAGRDSEPHQRALRWALGVDKSGALERAAACFKNRVS